ncbi:hypothetical protein [Palleronia pelagia]|uniref:hypothetical protein n=1 Tax=Palleronia pelagia TaxID=387096 RepID=UPI0011146B4D|nr:hypothetical protein [Palleronia pelagia]
MSFVVGHLRDPGQYQVELFQRFDAQRLKGIHFHFEGVSVPTGETGGITSARIGEDQIIAILKQQGMGTLQDNWAGLTDRAPRHRLFPEAQLPSIDSEGLNATMS